MFKLNRNQFAFIAYCSHFIANQDIRFYLNGLRFEVSKGSNELRITATDGHTLADSKIQLDEPAKSDMSFILHKDDVASLLSMASKIKSAFDAEFDMPMLGTISVNLNGSSVSFKNVGGKYPDVDRVMPASDRECNLKTSLGINADYIAKISKGVKSAKKFNRSVQPYMKINIGDHTQALLITLDSFKDTKTIIMPIRL